MSGRTPIGHVSLGHLNPCTAAEAGRYSAILWQLLDALDGEIVVAALVGQGKPDLLDGERQEVDRVRDFLHGRIAMRSQPTHLRACGLAVLDAFAHEFEAAAVLDHGSSPSLCRGGCSVGEGRPGGVEVAPPPGPGTTTGGGAV